jgi:hypothetical protein
MEMLIALASRLSRKTSNAQPDTVTDAFEELRLKLSAAQR